MLRALTLTLCLTLLFACGDDAGPGDDSASSESSPAPDGSEEFALQVSGTPRPGQRLPVRLTGDRAGVEIAIFRAIDPVGALGRLPEPDRGGDAGFRWDDPRFEEIWRRRATAGRRFVFPRAAPGVFAVAARREERSTARTLVICNLITVVKRSGAETLVYAAGSDTGLPASGVPVLLVTENGRSGGRTDASGVYRGSDVESGRGVLTALAGDAENLARPVRMPPVAGSGPADAAGLQAWFATDRPACFPGQEIHFRGILREREGHRYRVGDAAVRFTAHDANGRPLLPPTDLPALVDGEFEGSVSIPGDAPTGTCRILVTSDSGEHHREFQVTEPCDPHLRVRASFLPASPGANEPVSVVVRAADRYGSIPSGARVHYRVSGASKIRPGEWEVLARGEKALEAGEVTVTVFTPRDHERYRAHAEVRDSGGTLGSDIAELGVETPGLTVRLEPDRLFCTTGEEVVVRVSVLDAQGQEGPHRGEFRVGDTATPVTCRGGETLEFRVSFDRPGRHGVSATFDITKAIQTRAFRDIVAIGPDGEGPPNRRMEVLPEKVEYRPGEQARVLVLLPEEFAGVTCLETLECGRLGSHSVRRADRSVFLREFRIPEGFGGAGAFEVGVVRDRRVVRARGEFRVEADQGVLTVTVEAEPEAPEPGEEVRVRIRVRDAAGEPVAARASLSVFDERLMNLLPHPAPSIEEFFHGPAGGGVVTASSRSGAAAGVAVGERGPRDQDADAGPVHALSERAGRSLHWEPRLTVGQDGVSPDETFVLPPHPTRWRVVARVATPDTRVGTGELTLDVGNPLTVAPHLPGILVEGDIVRAPVSIRHGVGGHLSGELSLEADGLRLMDEALRPIKFEDGSPEAVEVVTLVAERNGEARLAAEFGRKRAVSRVSVTPRGRRRRFFGAGALSGDRMFVPFTLPASARTESAELIVRFHRDPLAALVAGVREAPAGESLGVRLSLASVAERAAGYLESLAGDPGEEEVEGHAALLHEADTRQRGDGGWGWADEAASDPLESLMVLEGLHEMQVAGAVPRETLERGLAYLRGLVSDDQDPLGPVLKMYAIRVLGLSGGPLPSAAESCLGPGERDRLPPAAAAHLILALLGADRRRDAAVLAARLDATAHAGDGGRAFWGDTAAGTFDRAAVPATSAALLAHLALGSETSFEHAERAGRHLLSVRQGESWSSGLHAAFAGRALLALAKNSRGRPSSAEPCAVRVRLGNAIIGGCKLDPAGPDSRAAAVRAGPGHLVAGRNRLAIESTGALKLLWTVDVAWRETGAPSPNPDLRIARSIRKPANRPEFKKITARPGEILMVALVVESGRPRRRLQLDCPLPAGTLPLRSGAAEALTPKLPRGARLTRRPGGVRLLIPEIPEGATRIEFPVRVTFAGRFHTPPATLRSVDFPSDEGVSAEGPMLYAE